jgi:hypothetical protein
LTNREDRSGSGPETAELVSLTIIGSPPNEQAGDGSYWLDDLERKQKTAWFLLGIKHKDRLPASGFAPVTVAGPLWILTTFRYPRGAINITLLCDKVKVILKGNSKKAGHSYSGETLTALRKSSYSFFIFFVVFLFIGENNP